jgi:hypothetical protein
MRIYDDAPRREYEDVMRSIGRILDLERLRDVLLVEIESGFLVRGWTVATDSSRGEWGSQSKLELQIGDDDIQTHLEAAFARRGSSETGGQNEVAMRILGHHVDSLKASDIMVTEQAGDWLLRCIDPKASRHQLFEFTGDDVKRLTGQGVQDRRK